MYFGLEKHAEVRDNYFLSALQVKIWEMWRNISLLFQKVAYLTQAQLSLFSGLDCWPQ